MGVSAEKGFKSGTYGCSYDDAVVTVTSDSGVYVSGGVENSLSVSYVPYVCVDSGGKCVCLSVYGVSGKLCKCEACEV